MLSAPVTNSHAWAGTQLRSHRCCGLRHVGAKRSASRPTLLCSTETSFPQLTGPVVDDLLSAIKDSDFGSDVTTSKREAIAEKIRLLEQEGAKQSPRPLKDPRIFGNYVVSYTPSHKGQPAGGRFRSGIGKTLFRTRGLFQSILQPNLAINKVEFNFLGFIPGYVGLRGQFEPVDGSEDTVKVEFEPPVLNLFNKLTLSIGPTSSVVLTTTYLDDAIRLGKGKFGSIFVFTRGGAADNAGMEKVGLEKKATVKGFFVWALYLGALAACLAVAMNGGNIQRAVCAAVAGLATALKVVLIDGGIADGPSQNKQTT